MATTNSVNIKISNILSSYCLVTDLRVDVLVYDINRFKADYNN